MVINFSEGFIFWILGIVNNLWGIILVRKNQYGTGVRRTYEFIKKKKKQKEKTILLHIAFNFNLDIKRKKVRRKVQVK